MYNEYQFSNGTWLMEIMPLCTCMNDVIYIDQWASLNNPLSSNFSSLVSVLCS